ncbi:ankyrin repeat domain-containing protein [Wolbachia endosymbiont of Ctenocephalides felis wCfeJ]|uniref:ankyrin repeat domain-containing protein n=1 Tax=Wolbachia endosymbiont of Ctenocephalides felis wCfeJ TaxID=2732594 RepID=UPI00144779E7|nr:ankyrin repeat domain-containing protein [Wolbachia endosymbiont of Ctenocephalides felis wCfeJ]WCR58323.1 MAG: hypothetical protein PG980_000795 [Wolbachia endosymbiont of Ctenocephalides felis wCfeJ]
MEKACKDPSWIECLEKVLSESNSNTSMSAINVHIMNDHNKTPLDVACELDNLNVVNMLLEYGADPNVYHSDSPLYYALRTNKVNFVEALLKYGAETDYLDYRGFSRSTIEMLLPYASDKQRMFHYIVKSACKDPSWIECLEVLLKYNSDRENRIIDVNRRNGQSDTPLCVACELGNLNVVNMLLEYGADPNIRGISFVPLHIAIKENNIDIAKVLLERSAETDDLDYRGFSRSTIEMLLPYASDKQRMFHYIVKSACKDPSWIDFLNDVLSKDNTHDPTSAIDVNIIGDYNKTPLYIACELGNLDVVNILLRHGANPNVHGTSCIPLHIAIKENKIDIAKALLEHGAKAEELNSLEIIKFSRGVVEMLLPHLSSTTKNLMLHHIAAGDSMETNHDIEIAKLLLGAGVDPKFCIQAGIGKSSSSALHCAKLKGKGKLVKLFNGREENSINNDLHCVQQPITDNTTHNSPQKQSSRGKWMIIVPALLCSAMGATLATRGIIPEIAAIGITATVVLSGITGAVVGGVAGYLVDVTISQCCSNQQRAT